MPRRASTAPLLALDLDRASAVPAYRQLYDGIRAAILDGRLAPGARLPSTRGFAAELGLARNTVALAFDQLLSEGYVRGTVGSGTYVSPVLPDALLSARRDAVAPPVAEAATGQLSQRGQVLAALEPRPRSTHRAFPVNRPDFDAFPIDLWGRLMARWWRHPDQALLRARDPAGYAPLRRAIAAYLGSTRALACTAEQVIVTSGAQHALDLAARLLLDPGDRAWVEEPGYRGFRAALGAAGATPIPVPVDAEGLSVEAGLTLAPRARLAAVAPSHQYPLGITMSLRRRLELLDWARAADAWIIEDDYDSEYRYAGRPLAALMGLDGGGRTIYVGTFSKVMFASLRIGYLVLPPGLVEPFRRARSALDDHPPIAAQPALAEFIEAGHFAAHVRRTRALYASRQAVLVDAIGRRLAGLLAVAPDDAGMHLVATLPAGLSDVAVANAADRMGVAVEPLSGYYAGPPQRQGLLLGYTAVDERAIPAGVEKLARAIDRARAATN